MPYSMMMQAAAPLFATVMASMVVMFPTPSDLVDTVFPPKIERNVQIVSAGADSALPAMEGTSTRGLITEGNIDACIDALSSTTPFDLDTCRNAIRAAARNAVDPRSMVSPDQKAKIEFAATLYCRAMWTKAATANENFSLPQCQSIALALAD